MVSYAIQKHIGAVGAKLLYPDMTIQHGGVLLGVGMRWLLMLLLVILGMMRGVRAFKNTL
ncbi:MAG: hypothetical protein ACLRQF_07335 [Thomasclavelia ramosa]